MKNFILILLIPLAFSMQMAIAQNAPISTIGSVVTYGTTTVVPITVTGFTNIGSCELYLNFDPNIVTITDVTKGPGVSSFNFVHGEESPGHYKIIWLFFQYGVPGLTLADNSVFLNITFAKVTDGYSAIEFNNISHNCLYGDEAYVELNDTPNSTYYIDGSITQLSSTQWTGNVSNDWMVDQNWTAGVPSSYRDAIIPDVLTNPYPLLNTGNGNCYGLQIDAAASLSIGSAGVLTAYNNVLNNGQLTIQSSNLGDGSFIDNGSISGTGASSVERYITSERWHYISPPVSGAVSGLFWDIYMTRWDEPTGVFSYIVTNSEVLVPMKGYGCWASNFYTGTTTVTYNGMLNTGTQSALGLTNTAGASHNSKGFNFVGNPYPSAIDWDVITGWTKTNLDNAIYIWNPSAGQYGSYVNGFSQNGVTNIIPRGQGFFVHVTTGNPTGSIQVNNEARMHSNVPIFKDSEMSSDESQISLKIQISSSINTYSDQCIVKFDEQATADFDPILDAFKILQGLEDAPNLYFTSPVNDDLSINTLPVTDDDQWIPLSYSVGINGMYALDALQMENCENKYVYLKDLKENVVINIKEQPSYQFYGEIADEPGRFQIMLLNSVLDVNDVPADRSIQIYSDRNVVYLVNGKHVFSGDLHIYNTTGQLVYHRKLMNRSSFEVKLNLKEGIYIVKLLIGNVMETQKVFIAN